MDSAVDASLSHILRGTCRSTLSSSSLKRLRISSPSVRFPSRSSHMTLVVLWANLTHSSMWCSRCQFFETHAADCPPDVGDATGTYRVRVRPSLFLLSNGSSLVGTAMGAVCCVSGSGPPEGARIRDILGQISSDAGGRDDGYRSYWSTLSSQAQSGEPLLAASSRGHRWASPSQCPIWFPQWRTSPVRRRTCRGRDTGTPWTESKRTRYSFS